MSAPEPTPEQLLTDAYEVLAAAERNMAQAAQMFTSAEQNLDRARLVVKLCERLVAQQ